MAFADDVVRYTLLDKPDDTSVTRLDVRIQRLLSQQNPPACPCSL